MSVAALKSTDSIGFAPARRLAQLIRTKQLSATEVADCFLRRIECLDPSVHAYLTVDEQAVRTAAAAADKLVSERVELPPLHGVPVAVKDLECTRGTRTTFGSALYADHVPAQDAITVERLRAAGAIVLGKTNTPAFGWFGETWNVLGEECRNPWDLTRTTSGSSGGSAAAAAAGMAPVATGTDAAGSISGPAAMCGIYGFKPTHGRIPTWPDPGDALLFLHNGPMTRDVADAALLLAVMAGHDERDPVSLRTPPADYLAAVREGAGERLRIAWTSDLGHFPVDPEVRAAVARAAEAFQELGHDVELATPAVEHPLEVYEPLFLADVRTTLGGLLRRRDDDLVPETAADLVAANRLVLEDYVRALNRLAHFRSAMAAFFERWDLLLTPVTAVPAFRCGQPPASIDGVPVAPGWKTYMPFPMAWNMTGQPTATVPCGFSEAGLPIGVLIVGRREREDVVLRASAAFERARPWKHLTPPLAVPETRALADEATAAHIRRSHDVD